MRTAGVMIPVLLAATVASAQPPSSSAARNAAARAGGAALQGDGPRALSLLLETPETEFSGQAAELRRCLLSRLAPEGSVEPPTGIAEELPRRALAVYRAYWQAALSRPAERDVAERRLLITLRRLLDRDDLADMTAAETLLNERLRAEGYRSLQGRTGPCRELMMWRSQTERNETVALPEGPQVVRLILLDDFDSLGWGHYATCGRSTTGGWTTRDAVHAVVPGYRSLDDEAFRVGLLGHEAQHFADLERFTDLPQWVLEYRAKLVEAALARETLSTLLQRFAASTSEDPAQAHAYANLSVLQTLRVRLDLPTGSDLATADGERVGAAAVEALREDTRLRLGVVPQSQPPTGRSEPSLIRP